MDGTFLKGRYCMTLLAAVTLDANNKTLPLAWAVVFLETLEHWSWFLHHLILADPIIAQRSVAIGSTFESSIVVLSDRDKGPDSAVAKYLSLAIQGQCCQHIAAKVQAKFGLSCQKLLWAAAKATSQSAFDKVLNQMEKMKKRAKAYLKSMPAERWATWAFKD